ncbi:hypothetical protein FRC09_003224 [Ceratobasidium sp. 395]|nr:hypothetical protein FRC09_003224 [Ceratobasidium sp. 395]
MPKTNEERTMNEPKTEQALGGNAITEDPDDEPGMEMAKGARVWQVYVKETDQLDKEMVDGRNKFIIESLGDLKPDSAESSAKTLLAISQKLEIIASGQRTTPPLTQESDSGTFSPSHASVIVNVLWLLSLSLSVAVSLIAMLAKEWCYKFMSGRSGLIYEQGRRRQQKWDGMEKWKMQEVLTYLPGLMHIALLLFAVGLCIYLWDVNVGVAIPVTAVTSIATCVYVLVTILPWLDQFCPYSTPVTSSRSTVAPLWKKVHHIVCSMVNGVWQWVDHPKWLESALERLRCWVEPVSSNTVDRSEDAYAPMDAVTSQMLAWMILNCEDLRSVNVALQALAGAGTELPHAELARNKALNLVEAQLRACVQGDRSSGENCPKSVDALYPALRYGRAYSMLVSGDSYDATGSWTQMDRSKTRPPHVNSPDISAVVKLQTEYAESVSVKAGVLATAWAACVRLSHIGPRETKKSTPAWAIDSLASLLTRHISSNSAQIPEPALLILLESCPHYMVGRWPLEENRKRSMLPPILVCVFLMSRDTTPDVAHIVAITLAAAAFATVKLSKEEVDDMFMFGLIGLLPHLSTEALKAPALAIPSKLYNFITGTDFTSYRYRRLEIFTLPESYNWSTHLRFSHQRFTPETMIDPAFTMDTKSDLLYPLLLRAQLHHHQSFVAALSFLHSAQSKELQDTCIDALILHPVANIQSQPSALRKYKFQLCRLLGSLLVSDKPLGFVVTFYFRLFMATAMLYDNHDLSERQSSLRCLVDCHRKFMELRPAINDSEPFEDRILEHVEERISEGDKHTDHLLCTMQLVVDFCHADPNKFLHSKTYQVGLEETPSWVVKLQKLKDEFDSTVRPNPAGATSPCRLPYI